MNEKQYEHRYAITHANGNTISGPAASQKATGDAVRNIAKQLRPGESVEIQRREVGPWETVERREEPK